MTIGHDAAREMFVNGNMQPAMQAFMKGEIKVDGDMTKVMALRAGRRPRSAPAGTAAEDSGHHRLTLAKGETSAWQAAATTSPPLLPIPRV